MEQFVKDGISDDHGIDSERIAKEFGKMNVAKSDIGQLRRMIMAQCAATKVEAGAYGAVIVMVRDPDPVAVPPVNGQESWIPFAPECKREHVFPRDVVTFQEIVGKQ
jgi:hypothetical protein